MRLDRCRRWCCASFHVRHDAGRGDPVAFRFGRDSSRDGTRVSGPVAKFEAVTAAIRCHAHAVGSGTLHHAGEILKFILDSGGTSWFNRAIPESSEFATDYESTTTIARPVR